MFLVLRTVLSTLLVLATTFAPRVLQAQTGTSLSGSYDTVLSRFQDQFVAVAKAMPADKYEFTPASLNLPNANFNGVRTFAAEVKHVAEMNFAIYSVMSGISPDMDMDSIKNLKSKDEILTALNRSFAFGHKALATLTLANANEMPSDSHGMTRVGIAAYAVVHAADHYGQLSEYLRMNGIVPPQSNH